MLEWLEENALLLMLVLENAISTIRSFKKSQTERKAGLLVQADKQSKALAKTVEKLGGD